MESEAKSCADCGTPFGDRKRCYKCRRGGTPMRGEMRACGTCGKSFYVPRWKLNDTSRNQGKYCSRECKHEGLRRDAALPGAQKQCRACGEVKLLAAFPPDKRTLDGKQSYCRECTRQISDRWREENPEKYEALKKKARTERQKLRRFELNLEQNYGLTLARYHELLADQKNVCKICGNDADPMHQGGRLHVDHCHVTGVVRGLLCGHCNTAIGLLKEDPTLFEAAVKYLRAAAPVA